MYDVHVHIHVTVCIYTCTCTYIIMYTIQVGKDYEAFFKNTWGDSPNIETSKQENLPVNKQESVTRQDNNNTTNINRPERETRPVKYGRPKKPEFRQSRSDSSDQQEREEWLSRPQLPPVQLVQGKISPDNSKSLHCILCQKCWQPFYLTLCLSFIYCKLP